MNFYDCSQQWFELNRAAWTLKTQDGKLKLLQNHIYPEIGKMLLVDIKPRHVLVIIKNLEARNKTKSTRVVRQIISKIFNFGIANEYCEFNPATGLNDAMKPHRQKNHPFLHPNQLTQFFHAVEKKGRLTAQGKRAFLLIALTGLRSQECIGARWEEIDLKKQLWTIPASRMKMKREHVIPLTPQMTMIFNLQKGANNTYVFPSPQDQKKSMNPWSLSRAIHHAGYGGKHVLHGFRHLFSTVSYESNLWRDDAIEMSLAHIIGGVRGVYNKAKYIDERKKLMTWYDEKMVIWAKDLLIN